MKTASRIKARLRRSAWVKGITGRVINSYSQGVQELSARWDLSNRTRFAYHRIVL